jgi:hypothetical protein
MAHFPFKSHSKILFLYLLYQAFKNIVVSKYCSMWEAYCHMFVFLLQENALFHHAMDD